VAQDLDALDPPMLGVCRERVQQIQREAEWAPEKVAVLIARGLTNCRVACELTISEHTDSRPTKAFLTLL